MVIIQQPSTISMSGNMLPFIINSGSLVNFTLKDGANVLIEATYEPDATGKITIDIKDIIGSRLKYKFSDAAFYEQTEIVKQFTATIDAETVTFKVIRCGVLDLADTPTNWLTGNFLTWQPQNKAVTYHSPEWLTYYATQACNIKLKAYFPGEAEQNLITLDSCQAGKAFTFNLQFAHIAGLLGQTYPTHYDLWAEKTTGERLSFIQRYYFSEVKSEQENWFGFENSLGGLDFLRASGDGDLSNDSTHNLAIVDGEVQEYKIDTKRIYTKNTGHLTDYERRWLLDFPSARKKYIYHNGSLRQIAVTETNFRYSVSDSPTDYTFKYRFINQSSCLNLTRSEHLIPSSIVVPDIDAPGFFLPPRLAEFPRVTLSEGTLIPAFDPLSNKATVTTVGALVGKAVEETISAVPGHAEGGTLVQVIGEESVLPATDKNVFSGLRSIKEITNRLATFLTSITAKFLRKDIEDSANEKITFKKGAQYGPDYISGMLGKGGHIDKDGNATLESATLRSFLEAPEYRFNRIEVVEGETILTEHALFEEVQLLSEVDKTYKITPKLVEGDHIAISAGSLLKGIFHEGFGFSSSFLIVDEVNNTAEPKYMNVRMEADENTPTGNNLPPQKFMKVARVGHQTDVEKQRYITLSSIKGGLQIYAGAYSFKSATIAGSLDIAQDFKNMYDNLPLMQGVPYAYLKGLVAEDFIRVDYKGREIQPQDFEIEVTPGNSAIDADSDGNIEDYSKASADVKLLRNGKEIYPYLSPNTDKGNLLREMDLRFDFKYWGGSGETIFRAKDTPPLLATQNNKLLITQNGQAIWISNK